METCVYHGSMSGSRVPWSSSIWKHVFIMEACRALGYLGVVVYGNMCLSWKHVGLSGTLE